MAPRGVLSLALAAALAPAARAALQTSTLHDPVASAQGLITRLLGAAYLPRVQLEVIPPDADTGRDAYEIDAAAGNLVLRGNSGVALASALGAWLKEYTNSSWHWGRDGTGNYISLPVNAPPAALPLPPARVRTVSPVKYRYSYNVCTYGYSLVWYTEKEWQAEVGRLAMWGVNLPVRAQRAARAPHRPPRRPPPARPAFPLPHPRLDPQSPPAARL